MLYKCFVFAGIVTVVTLGKFIPGNSQYGNLFTIGYPAKSDIIFNI